MGLFDLFRSKDPTIDQFAHLLINTLKKAGLAGAINYDPEGQFIRLEDSSHTIFVSNYYREYLQVPSTKRSEYLKDRVALYLEPHETIPDDFDEARPNLRPKIWSRMALESIRLHILAKDSDSQGLDMHEYELGDYLVAGLGYDHPETTSSIGRTSLEIWGVTYYEALEVARNNLAEQPYSVGRLAEVVYMVNNNDGYDACRLLVPAILDKFPVQGDQIAVIPNPDLLLVTGSEDSRGLEILLDLIDQFEDHPRPILPLPLRRDGDDWVDWLPKRSHPLYLRFKKNEYRYFLQIYEQQRRDLIQLFEKTEKDIFSCDYQVYGLEDGSCYSLSIWSSATDFLLPPTDVVVFRKPEGGATISVPWDRVESVLGNLMQPTDYYPPRVRIQSPTFPSDEQLAELAVKTVD